MKKKQITTLSHSLEEFLSAHVGRSLSILNLVGEITSFLYGVHDGEPGQSWDTRRAR